MALSEDPVVASGQIRPRVVPFWVVVANWLGSVAFVPIGLHLGSHNDRWDLSSDVCSRAIMVRRTLSIWQGLGRSSPCIVRAR